MACMSINEDCGSVAVAVAVRAPLWHAVKSGASRVARELGRQEPVADAQDRRRMIVADPSALYQMIVGNVGWRKALGACGWRLEPEQWLGFPLPITSTHARPAVYFCAAQPRCHSPLRPLPTAALHSNITALARRLVLRRGMAERRSLSLSLSLSVVGHCRRRCRRAR